MSASIGTKIDHVINETERTLSKVALYPVIGTVAGLSKALMGVAQLIVGVVGGIFTLPARCMNNPQLNDRFWTHAKHGAANIVAGVLEAIPFLGTYMYVKRASYREGATLNLYVKNGHLDKFMPYTSLLERDLEIKGDNFENERKAVLKFDQQAKTLNSYEKKLQLAQDIAKEINDEKYNRNYNNNTI